MLVRDYEAVMEWRMSGMGFAGGLMEVYGGETHKTLKTLMKTLKIDQIS
jgi:hypothetical protein